MPVDVKDIIETIDMATENGSPLFAGFQGNRDSRQRRGAARGRGLIVGKTVTTEFAWMTAARHAQSVGSGAHARRVEQRLGRRGRGRRGHVAIGTQVFGSILRPASFCGCFGFKPTVGAINRGGSHDALSQSTHGPLAASLPEAWACRLRDLHVAPAEIPALPASTAPPACPAPSKPRRLAVLETDGWAVATPAAKAGVQGRVRET